MRRAGLLCLSLLLTAGCRQRPPAPPPGSSATPPVKIIYPAAPGSFVKTLAGLKEGVVQLSTTAPVRGGPGDWFPPGDPGEGMVHAEPLEQMRRSLGTGFIIDAQGTILTSAHVPGKDREVRVLLPQGSTVKARLVGLDERSGVAVLDIDPPAGVRLTPVRLGDSDELEVGEWVVAVGNPFGTGLTASAGVVSARERRDLPLGGLGNLGLLQTDAAIHPGNSGGPLVNVLGEVVGINLALSQTTAGLGFAIPIRTARKLLPMLQREGRVVRAYLGVYIERVTPAVAARAGLKDPRGALISQVVARGPAERAGLRPGDILIAFDGRALDDPVDLPWLASLAGIGRQVPLKVWRGDKTLSFSLKTEAMPE